VSSGADLQGAVSVSAATHVTLTGELLYRRFDELGRIGRVLAPHPVLRGVETLRLVPAGDSTTALGALGVKWNLGSAWLLRANVVVPLTDAGLTAPLIPSVAFEYNFGR